MTALSTTLIAVLDKLLWLLLAYKRTEEGRGAQHERDKISKNPSAWFANHFSNGLSKQPNKTDSSDETKS